MGFRTLAIHEDSSAVWKLLVAIENQFGKFGIVIEEVKKKLERGVFWIVSSQYHQLTTSHLVLINVFKTCPPVLRLCKNLCILCQLLIELPLGRFPLAAVINA